MFLAAKLCEKRKLTTNITVGLDKGNSRKMSLKKRGKQKEQIK